MSSIKERFNEKLQEIDEKEKKNILFFNNAQYESFLKMVEDITENEPEDRMEFYVKGNYEIRLINGIKRIFRRKSQKEIVPKTEIFDVLRRVHSSTGHGDGIF